MKINNTIIWYFFSQNEAESLTFFPIMYAPKVKSNRQQAKEKAKVLIGKVTIVIGRLEIMCKFQLICADLYFFVQWEEHDEEDGHDLLDVLPAKAIVAEGEVDVVSLSEGNKSWAIFNKKVYPVTIKGSGE